MSSKLASGIQLLLAASIFYLGFSIYAMTNKVGEIMETYPKMLEDAAQVTDELQIDEWLKVADTIDTLLPKVIDSVEGITTVVRDVNNTAASIDAKIPAIIQETTQYRQDVIPAVLSETKQYRTQVVPPILEESKAYRTETIPLLTKESQALRNDIPPILVKAEGVTLKADEILEKSQELAQQATQGAVKGVIMSPIDLLRDAGNEVKDRVIPFDE